MRKKLLISIILLAIFTVGVIFFIKWRFFSEGVPVVFEITPGQTVSQIAKNLQEKGIIHSQLWFKLVVRLSSTATDLKAGKYNLRTHMPAEAALNCIKSGQCQHLTKLTIPEGWRSEEIAETLAENNVTDPRLFLDLVHKRDLEGKLFPSTYYFAENTPAVTVIETMLSQYNARVKPLFKQYPTSLTEKEVLTVASIVEREAIFHDEKPKIAAVYLNRLKIGKRLEADPTVQYAVGFNLRENRYWKKGLTYKDLRHPSPYNTYRYNGLPPAPIANPSYESIKAVLAPEAEFDALYFVADNTGRHDFSNTYNEHLIKKNKYRRK
ncbi:MAG: endolytic transglycosylase MltG [Elusimicrobiaceae bacterium]|nr:endolytic transglycosylase MltG [Elusimicrobiaceae bacterium]